MNKKLQQNGIKREYLYVTIIMTVMGAIYYTQLTATGLWLDEAVEYFYSKYMTGHTPIDGYNNMYERIVSTFQPPLYNILMYLWLLLFDSEFTFRLVGVLTSFIGAYGFYCTLKHITNSKWSLLGIVFYLSTASIIYYALECAEYNLMLCMECWMLYFFMCIYIDTSRRIQAIIGFYLFATLSVYSQYGAAFLIVAMFISLCVILIKQKDYRSLRWLLGAGFLTMLITIIPLYYWFTRLQMHNQEATEVSHYPFFEVNILYSLGKTLISNITWIFTLNPLTAYSNIQDVHYIFFFIVITLFITLGLLLSNSEHKKSYSFLLTTNAICYLLFFFASASSYYAHNDGGNIGTFNICGNRYVLFLTPLVLLTLWFDMFIIWKKIASYYSRHISFLFIIAFMVLFVFTNFSRPTHFQKSDCRKVFHIWMEKYQLDDNLTLVNKYSSASFMYYYVHSNSNNRSISSNIIIADKRIQSFNENVIIDYLEELGVFLYNKVAFFGSRGDGLGSNNLYVVSSAFKSRGYEVKKIYDGETVLLQITK